MFIAKNISALLAFIPILFFFRYKHNYKNKQKLLIQICLVLSFVKAVITIYTNNNVNTALLTNLYTLVETEILLLFFANLYAAFKKIVTVIYSTATVFLIFWVVQNFLVQSIHQFDYFSLCIEYILLFVLCILYLLQQLIVITTQYIYYDSNFWIVSAILIFCAATFFSFLIPISYSLNQSETRFYDYLTTLGYIVKNALLLTSFCIYYKPLSNNSLNNPASIL